MKVIKSMLVISAFAASSFMVGCGGVSEAEMQELNKLKSDVNSAQTEIDQLKGQRSDLEKTIADSNAKLMQCEKEKAEVRANLDKLPK
ncbi:MAG: hypothetical protein Q8903_06645 [Bacteroidota bacterium]|nr:hypothetical protein [Bacteroidota bacterium]